MDAPYLLTIALGGWVASATKWHFQKKKFPDSPKPNLQSLFHEVSNFLRQKPIFLATPGIILFLVYILENVDSDHDWVFDLCFWSILIPISAYMTMKAIRRRAYIKAMVWLASSAFFISFAYNW